MRGYLTYLILWNSFKNNMNGAELAKELEKRKGTKPNPGTLYPALKELKAKDLIKADKNNIISLEDEL